MSVTATATRAATETIIAALESYGMRGKTMICTECLIRGKDWEGSDPKCAFDNDEKLFSTDNWNCATMNKLRERADYHVNDDLNAA